MISFYIHISIHAFVNFLAISVTHAQDSSSSGYPSTSSSSLNHKLEYAEILNGCIKSLAEYYEIDNLNDLTKEDCVIHGIKFLSKENDADRFAYENGYYDDLGLALDSSDIQKSSDFCSQFKKKSKKKVNDCKTQLRGFTELPANALHRAYFNFTLENTDHMEYAVYYMNHMLENFKVKNDFPNPYNYCDNTAKQSGRYRFKWNYPDVL